VYEGRNEFAKSISPAIHKRIGREDIHRDATIYGTDGQLIIDR
jgi:hypothetical protein